VKQAKAINKGRLKAGLKRIAFKILSKGKKSVTKRTKTAKNKKKGNPHKSVAKSKRMSKLECFLKGGFGGAGVGETLGFGLEAVGAPAVIAVPSRMASAAAGGYYIGGKKIEGLLGGIIFEIIPSVISILRGGGGRASRLGGL